MRFTDAEFVTEALKKAHGRFSHMENWHRDYVTPDNFKDCQDVGMTPESYLRDGKNEIKEAIRKISEDGQMKIQKVVTVTERDGAYYNFFFTPGSIDSLENLVRQGWRVLFIKDSLTNKMAVAVFERDFE